MPLIGKGSFFTLVISNCKKWDELSDLIKAVEQIQEVFSFSAVFKRSIQETSFMNLSDIARYCTELYEQSRHFYQNRSRPIAARIRLELLVPFMESTQNKYIFMDAIERKDGSWDISFSIILDRRVSIDPKLTLQYAEKIMQLYISMCQILIPLSGPEYVWMAEDDEHTEHLSMEDILNRQLKVIYWTNYFGPNYLNEKTKNLFLQSPVGIVKPFEDGIWYQLHEEFEHVPHQTIVDIEDRVMDYFSELNLERVQWKFEYG